MAFAKSRKSITKTSIEFRSILGKSGKQYLVVKGHRQGGDFFEAFGAQELKEACLDILGRNDRAKDSNSLAKEVWYKLQGKI